MDCGVQGTGLSLSLKKLILCLQMVSLVHLSGVFFYSSYRSVNTYVCNLHDKLSLPYHSGRPGPPRSPIIMTITLKEIQPS